jgi:hypothetical protein
LCQRQFDGGASLDGPSDGRFKVAHEPLRHRPKGEVADNSGKVTDAAGQSLQHGERDSRASLTELKHLGARKEKRLRGRERDRRGDVAAAVEEWPFAERGARTFGVKHLLAATEGDLPHLDASFRDDEQTVAGLSFLEEGLAAAEAPHRTPSGQVTQLLRRQCSKVRNLPQSCRTGSRALGSRLTFRRDSGLAHGSEAYDSSFCCMVKQKSRQVRHAHIPQSDARSDDQHSALAARKRLSIEADRQLDAAEEENHTQHRRWEEREHCRGRVGEKECADQQ